MSLVEVVVALSVLVVAASIFGQMLISTTRLRQVNHQNALAADAARVVLERMRNEPLLEVYRDFNEDPKDDPKGIGTGPGHLFDVPGLEAAEGAPGGRVGRVYLPSVAVEVAGSSGTGGASGVSGGKKGLGGGTDDSAAGAGATQVQWQLREDFGEQSLGMPRDLDGNNKIEAADRSKGYILLPVKVRIEWKSGTATRHFELVTQLGDYRLAEQP
ncbi:MAG: hypothetical protein EXS08_10220 [Planctomycetes bacterium]|nr:hypothetical protein [Planctomycetota bacterium]